MRSDTRANLRYADLTSPPPDQFANDLARVEAIGPNVRLIFAVQRQAGADAYREPVVAVVVPAAEIKNIMRKLGEPPRQIAPGNAEPDDAIDAAALH